MRLVWLFAITAAACSNSSAGSADAPAVDGHHVDSPPPVDSAAALTVIARVGALVVGPTMTTEAVDPTKLTVTLADGSSPQLTLDQDGTIAFLRASPTQAYTITTDPILGTTIVEDTARMLEYLPPVFGHTLLQPVAQGTLIDTNVTPASGSGAGIGSFAVLFATGQRSSVALPSPYFVAAADWHDALTSDGAPAGLLSTSEADLLWFVHYTAPTAGHTLADQALSMPVDQTSGSATTIAGTAQVIPTTGCVRASGAVTEELARFGSNVPGASTPTATLGVTSEPVGAMTSGGGDIAVGTATVAADTSVDIPYTTPFPNEIVVGAFEIDATVQHAVAGKKINTPATETVHVALGSGAYACTDPMLVQLPTGAAFATALTLGGVPVAADEQPITLAAGALLAVAVTASAGTADRYTIQLVDRTTSATLGTWVSSGSTFTIPRTLFTAGDTYSFTIRIDSGFPGAATGSLTAVTYPISSTTTSSYTFTTSG